MESGNLHRVDIRSLSSGLILNFNFDRSLDRVIAKLVIVEIFSDFTISINISEK